MRSYLASFTFLIAVLAGYTALVLKSTPAVAAKAQVPHETQDADHRQPAAAAPAQAVQATTNAASVD